MALDKIGYVKLAMTGDKAGALKAYQESLDITRNLAGERSRTTPSPAARRRRRPQQSRRREVRHADDPKGALAAYEESLAIMRRLADAYKNNAFLQRDASISLDKIADVKRCDRRPAGRG